MKPEKELRKESRGAMDSLVECDSNSIAVRCYDNRKVDVISTFIGIKPLINVKSYDKNMKEKVNVPCPQVINYYNENMGGIDLLDSLTALYKAEVKTRRWYIYIFYHTVNMAIVTSCQLYRRHCRLFNEKARRCSIKPR